MSTVNDRGQKWHRLTEFARHPNTIPDGEIEVPANVIVWADDYTRHYIRQNEELRFQLAEATKAGTAFWRERDLMNGMAMRIQNLEREVERLREFEVMYQGLCK